MSTRARLFGLMGAGLVDSLCLSVAWTVVVLQVTARDGLAATGAVSAAMLVGVALSAPFASWLATRLPGRRLLRVAAAVEASLRLGVFLLLFTSGPVWVLAVCVCAMNVVAWTGYAGMRAEVAAISPGSVGITWYGTTIVSIEAVGVGVAALLPGTSHVGVNGVLLGVLAAYLLALVPTVVLAGGSPVPRATRGARHGRLRFRASPPVVVGVLLMSVSSAPTLLAVALAAELHGKGAVGPAAVAFTLGSLTAPAVAARVQSIGANHALTWVVCAIGMCAGWAMAPVSVAWLCVAQLASGLCMTTLEGLLDTTAAALHPGAVTGALARSTAGRALGSAGGTAVLPLFVAGVGLSTTVGWVVALLAVAALVVLTRALRPVETARHRAVEPGREVAVGVNG
jgi:MFS family permease